MKHTLLLIILGVVIQTGCAQNRVSITIDDVPNTQLYQQKRFKSKLLKELDVLEIPVAIFINEGLLYKTDETVQNFALLNDWASRDYVTLGNHTFSHLRYSDIGIQDYKQEVNKGEAITTELAQKHNKSLKYIRFPYNDLGKDAQQHKELKKFLQSKNYTSTPFTVESSDWMYNALYVHYLNTKQKKRAKDIGRQYVAKTIEYFEYFEKIAQEQYGQPISHIYLCHDNQLNADFLPIILQELKAKKYSFISLDEAMEDDVYQQEDNYTKKWGISWLYRYMTNKKEAYQLMRKEPNTEDVLKLYESFEN